MQALIALIGSVVSGEASEAVARARRAAVIYTIAALLLFAGATFLLIAAFLAVARHVGSVNAGLWFGGGFVALAILLVIIHRVTTAVRARRIAKRRQAETRTIVSAAAVALIPTLLASRAGSVALLGPAVAALAYAVYRENTKRGGLPRDDTRPD